MASWYRTQLETYIKSLDLQDSGDVLDVGGADKPMPNRAGRFSCLSYTVLDHKETGFKTIVHDMNTRFGSWPECYDHVFCFELMEYIYDPATCVGNLYQFTKPGGTLYISFPRNYPDHNPLEIDYLRYTKRGAIKLLEAVGFEILEVRARKIAAPGSFLKAYRADGMHVGTEETVDDTGYIIKAKRPEATSRTQVRGDNINTESQREEVRGSCNEAVPSLVGGQPEPVRGVTL